MECATLYSGSSGNSIYVGTKKTKILVDAGLSGKRIKEALEEINIDIKEINALLVTHEHIDHIRGLGVLSRRYNIPIYASPRTWYNLSCIGEVKEYNKRKYEYGLTIGDLEVEFFKTFHDAIQPVGMAFRQGENKIGIATDTGCISPLMKKALQGAETLIFEANHDEEMLRKGPYPEHLKRRVASDVGHLSNRQAAKALSEIITKRTRQVVLAHLSAINNTPAIAHETVAKALAKANILDRIALTIAPRHEPHRLIKIKGNQA